MPSLMRVHVVWFTLTNSVSAAVCGCLLCVSFSLFSIVCIINQFRLSATCVYVLPNLSVEVKCLQASLAGRSSNTPVLVLIMCFSVFSGRRHSHHSDEEVYDQPASCPETNGIENCVYF